MAKRWNEEDVEFLKENYENLSYEEIGDSLGRSYGSVRSKAVRLGFSPKNEWDEEEIKYLEKNYYDKSAEEISRVLNRSEQSIRAKAYVIGIKKSHNWTVEQVNFLKNNWKNMTALEIGEKIGRTEKSVYQKTRALGLESKNLKLEGKVFGRLTVIEKTGERKNKNIVWKCLCECGNIKHVKVSDLISGQQKSCGCLRNELASKRLSQNLVGDVFGWLTVIKEKRRDKNIGIMWECICKCEKISIVSTRDLKSGNTKSCGCYRSWKNSGIRHHRYNHVLTNEERIKNRDVKENLVFRMSVFKRDDFTCKICGQRNGNHAAHHLNGWSNFPEERFDVNNGVTLCEPCHLDFHKKYGYGNNTKQQFIEFLNLNPLRKGV